MQTRAVVLIQLFWLWVVPTVICGEPYAPGWITPWPWAQISSSAFARCFLLTK